MYELQRQQKLGKMLWPRCHDEYGHNSMINILVAWNHASHCRVPSSVFTARGTICGNCQVRRRSANIIPTCLCRFLSHWSSPNDFQPLTDPAASCGCCRLRLLVVYTVYTVHTVQPKTGYFVFTDSQPASAHKSEFINVFGLLKNRHLQYSGIILGFVFYLQFTSFVLI